MILESIVTTTDATGIVNIAPLGPIVLPPVGNQTEPRFVLRPWRGSRTFDNLMQTGRAVIHVTDDVLILAQTAIGHIDASGLVCPIDELPTFQRLIDCHRWFAVEVTRKSQLENDRVELEASCIASGEVRPFFGFNRAMYAVIELAITATRLHLIDRSTVQSDIERWSTIVEKTAGIRERAAFELLQHHIEQSWK